MLPMMSLVGMLAQGAIADESEIDGKQRDVDGVRFDMGSERYRFELNEIFQSEMLALEVKREK